MSSPEQNALPASVITIARAFATPGLTARVSEDRAENLTEDAAFPRRIGRPDEYDRLAVAIIENPMLNGDTIRLVGGQRFWAAVSQADARHSGELPPGARRVRVTLVTQVTDLIFFSS